MPYLAGASPYHPTPLPERGCSVVPAKSLTPGNISPPDKSHVNPTSLMSPVSQNGICGEEHEIIHSGLQSKKKDQLANRQ